MHTHMKAPNSVFSHFDKSFGEVSTDHRAEIQWAQSGGEKLVENGNKKSWVERGHLTFGGGILKRAG